MWSVFEIVLPVCCLVAVGFATRLFGLVKGNADDVISKFVFTIPIPVLLFRLIATGDLEDANPWSIWGTYFIAAAVPWLLAAFLLPFLFKREVMYGVIGGVASSFANTVLIGIPIILQAYGEAGMVAVTVLLSIHLPLMLLATTLHHDIAQYIDGEGGVAQTTFYEKIKRVFLTIAKNPIMVGIFLGVVTRFSGLELPNLVLDVTGKISSIAGPMALIVLGMGLQKYGISGNVGPAIITASFKLVLHPALVFVLGTYVFDLPPLFTASLVILAASPAGVNSYLFAQHFGTGQALSANSITISTLLCAVSISFWLAILVATQG